MDHISESISSHITRAAKKSSVRIRAVNSKSTNEQLDLNYVCICQNGPCLHDAITLRINRDSSSTLRSFIVLFNHLSKQTI